MEETKIFINSSYGTTRRAIAGNPLYNLSLHLDFIEKSPLLEETNQLYDIIDYLEKLCKE